MEKAISISWRNGQDPEELNLGEFLKLSVADQSDELMAQAVLGNLPRLPKEFFTPENICFLTPTGGNLIHCAASYGQLEDVPLDIISTDQLKEALLAKNDKGETIFHIAFNSLLVKWGDVVNDMLTKEVLLMENDDRQTLFHWVAEVDGLDRLNPESYDRDMFLLEDATDKTPLYWAIANGSCKVPEDLLTEQNLMKTSIYDENAICHLFVAYVRSYMSSEDTCLQVAYLKKLLSKFSLEGLDTMWSKVKYQEYSVLGPDELINPLFEEAKSLKKKKELIKSRRKDIIGEDIEV